MERLVPHRLIGTLALFCCTLAAAGAAGWPSVDQELLHNARFWEAHDRGDLAQLALKKLIAARPDLSAALVELGELDLRLNDFTAAAQVESELDHRFAGSAAARDFATEVRISTRDRLQFASIRRLIEVGRTSEAAVDLQKLFPQGPPNGTLGIDYYSALSHTPGGIAAARAGLQKLAQRHAGDPRYQLGLAQLLVRNRDTALEGVSLLQQLTERDDARREDADRALASGLLRLGAERAPRTAISAYLGRHPEDTEVAALRTQQGQITEERALLSNLTLSRALPASQRMLARELASGSRPAQARAEARRWLDRSRASLYDHQQSRAASELRAALAFSRSNYEAEIGIAHELETRGSTAEAGELLASASSLAPESTWLFETRVRWLIAHGGNDAAVDVLRGPAARLSVASRNALLAQALHERATKEASAGQLDAAMVDLQAAIQLAPRDPWMRYRLAEYYRGRGEAERGQHLMSEGVQSAPDAADMRYAQGLYLEHLQDYQDAYAAIDGVAAAQRTEGMNALHDRMSVALARAEARRLKGAGDLQGARAALLKAEPAASHSLDAASELAYSWIALGDPGRGVGLVRPYVDVRGGAGVPAMLAWAKVLNSAEDDQQLAAALAQLHAVPQPNADERADVERLQRGLDLREVRALERQKKYSEAARHLDILLAADPQDRQLRVTRAELDLTQGQPRSARDRLASLAAENPDDLDARLSYVRALTESGDLLLARVQLQAIEALVPTGDEELQISLARRQLGLGAAASALRTLQPLLAVPNPRTDVLMLAGRAEAALHHLARARDYFDQAAASATAADDVLAAYRASQEVDDRLQSRVAAGLIGWHQPGDPGMSRLDLVTIPSEWGFPRDDGSRLIARADAVWLDAGRWSTSSQSPLLLGTIQAAGPGVPLRYRSEPQVGLSPGLGFQTESLTADVGATPLGFELPNLIGGIEWTPTWLAVDWTLGVARRAVTSSELSFAGLKDPLTGAAWGGVVQTGPYAGFGVYRENYDVSGSVRFVEITGTHVPDNQLAAARLSSSWKFLSLSDTHADAGVTLTYWNYQRNLSNYTFGSGGYYSPQSYVSLATPVEFTESALGWAYKLHGAVSYTISQVNSIAFYPDDPVLQAQGARAPLPPGYASPYFSGYRSSGFGFSASAAAERQLSDRLVIGFLFAIDRTDYYHPTSVGVYLRHAFGPRDTRAASPPRPITLYNP
jgi:cellulose synthase operon protein C